MKTFRLLARIILSAAVSGASLYAQRPIHRGDNAALRYWSAFAEMEDSGVTQKQAKELNQILAGTAPYNDLEYKDLIEKNRTALQTMARGSALPNCNWGIDYQLGPDAPMDYVRKALELGRLNVLYAFHLSLSGDKDGAVRALAAGVRFSRDVANGGTLFATLIAKSLLAADFRAMAFMVHVDRLSASERMVLEKSVAQLAPSGLDWQSAMRRELDVLKEAPSVPREALGRIIPVYLAALNNPSRLPELHKMIAGAPRAVQDVLPNPSRVVAEKQDLTRQLLRTKSMLR